MSRGKAARMAAPSSSVARTSSRPLPRMPGLISINSSGSSCERRLRYSAKPSATQAGMRSPTAMSRARTAGSVVGGSEAVVTHGPQALEAVELADAGHHHVDDDVAQVDQHPFGFGLGDIIVHVM